MSWLNVSFTLDPAWPWSLSGLGVPALAGTALVLMALTIWTYLGTRGASFTRILVVLLLRLAALVVAFLIVLRPSLGFEELEGLEPSQLPILVDASLSMNTKDEFNNESRWESARRILATPAVVQALKRISSEEKIQVVFYQGGDRVIALEPQSTAEGKRSHLGAWLEQLWDLHGGGANAPGKVRGIVFFSDGADNGPPNLALDKAKQWRGTAPIVALGLGKQEDVNERKDIIVAAVEAVPTAVPAKTKLTIKGLVHAPGFAGASVKVSLLLRDTAGKTTQSLGEDEIITLVKDRDNEIVLTRDAPEKAGEYKLTLKIDSVNGEADAGNNESTTFVDVTKEGVSILWVDRRRAYEPVFIQRYALSGDRRFRLYSTIPEDRRAAAWDDWYEFDKRQYDVIVIGDISADRFSGRNPQVFEKVRDLVKDGKSGLIMLGGVDAFAAGAWDKTTLAEVLPVKLENPGQLDSEVRVQPTEAALKQRFSFLMLDSDDAKNRALWAKEFDPLDGQSHLGSVREGATVLGLGNGKEPILVASDAGSRILIFGGDTTWRAWRKSPQTVAAFNKFWKQAVLWTARQDHAAGDLWVKLETRDVLANTPEIVAAQRLRFDFGMRGKTGLDIKNATYSYKLVSPDGNAANLNVSLESPQRGNIPTPLTPGEYQLQVAGKGKDPVDGSEVEGAKVVSFNVRADVNTETTRTAADHDLLHKLASASGGQFFQADERLLLKFLDDLKGQARSESRLRTREWPDWKRTPDPDDWNDQVAALWESSALVCFLIFAGLIGSEWTLRKLWGLA